MLSRESAGVNEMFFWSSRLETTLELDNSGNSGMRPEDEPEAPAQSRVPK